MILHIHSDASYLSQNESKSRAGGFFYMGSDTKTDKKLTNGAILIVSKVLKHIMASAAEAEIGAVFINTKEGAVIRTTLEELGHKHPPTPMETDNTTATVYWGPGFRRTISQNIIRRRIIKECATFTSTPTNDR
jgi:hypothetical protein